MMAANTYRKPLVGILWLGGLIMFLRKSSEKSGSVLERNEEKFSARHPTLNF
jgi:hypothetical protein